MTGRRGRGGGGGGGNRGGNRGRGAFQAAPSNKPTGLDALTGGTVARRGSGRGNHGGAGSRGRGGGFGGGFGAKKENTPEPVAPDDSYTGIPYDPKFAMERKGKLNTTPYPWHEYDKRYAYLKNAQRYKKQEQIAAGQLDPDGQMDLSKSVDKHGLCTDMCSELERVRRIVQKDVAGPEYSKETARGPRSDRQPDERRMIAAFHRSSAGDELTLMSDLRTPKALLNSMKVMINRLKEDDFGWLNGWMWDRSRAIRVELNKNYRLREDNEVYVQIYEMCIRFHLLSMHQMAKSKAIGKDYSRHTDWEQLGAACNQMKELWDKIKVYMPQDRKTPSPLEASRVAEIHAYNIIVGLKEPDHREEVRTHPRVRTAQAIVRLAQDTKNPAAFWRLVRSNQVSYLLACAAATRFNAVRVDTLEAMVKGFMVHKQKVEELTLVRLVDTLGFDTNDQVTAFCAEFGGEFETDHTNVTRLRPETLSIRRDPTILNKQIFSQNYVESKRGGRNLAAVLLGYDMRQAYAEGLVEAVPEEDKDSLFVPEGPTPSNPFTAAAAQAPSSIQPGLFDPSKDAIKFSTSSAAPAPTNPFAGFGAKLTTNGQSTTAATPAAGGNPFAQFAAKNTAAAAPATIEFGAPKAPAAANAFTFTKPAQNAFATPATTAAPTGTGTSSLFQTSAGSSTGFAGFSLTNPTNGLGGSTPSAAPSIGLTGFPKLPSFSTPSATLINPGTTAAAPLFAAHQPTSASSPTENGKQKETDETQRKAREEQERKAQEEQQRVVEEQRKAEEQRRAEAQRKAEEERKRKIQEEQAKALVAEQQRRLKEQKEAERLRLESEAARQTEEKRMRALEAMGKSLFINPREGFMTQYLQHLTSILAQETMDAMEAEQEARDNARADQMAQERRTKLARVAFYKWCQVVEHKRRKTQARRRRERRRQLQANSGELKSSTATSVASPTALEVQPVGEVREVPEDRPLTEITNGSTNETPSKPQQSQLAKNSSRAKKEVFTQPNGDFSQSYYEARAPPQTNEIKPIVDRTETNYFKLLAMGVDRETASSLCLESSKALKRSFGSTEEEDAPQTESSKRLRRSPSSVFEPPSRFHRSLPPTARPPSALRQSLPPPADDDERSARYRAIKASLARSGHRPSQSIDGSRTFRDSVSRQSTPLAHSTTTLPSDDRPKYWARESRFVPQHLYGKPDAIRAYRLQLGGMSASSSFATSEVQVQATKQQEPDPPNFLLSSPVAEAQKPNTGDLMHPALGFHPSATSYQVDAGMFPPGAQGLPERIAQAEVEEVLVIDDDDDADEEDVDADIDETEGENELELDLEADAEQWDGYGEENGDGDDQEVYYDEDEDDEILDSDDDDVSDEEEYDDDGDDAAQLKPGATQDDAIELSD